MINGQPLYTIQLHGFSIPIAAITIPTSEGPCQLQSAITSLPQSTVKLTNELSKQEVLQLHSEKECLQHEAIQSERFNPTSKQYYCFIS